MNLTSSCQNVQEVNVLDFWNAGEEFESDEDDDNDSDVEVWLFILSIRTRITDYL